jgi:hypothetical protein
MNTAALIWLVIFALSAVTFFTVAVVVTVKGISELRDLLGGMGKRRRESD